MITNPSIDSEAHKVLGIVSRAQSVFGGHTEPAEPPNFAAAPDLEDDLGRGHFGSALGSSHPWPVSSALGDDTGGDAHGGDMGDQFGNDFADRLITGGAWAFADGGLGTAR